MKTNTPKYELTFRWTNATLFTHWMEWRGCHSNFNLQSRVVLDTQVWLQTRDQDERSHLLAEALWLIPEESAEQRPWEGLERWADIRNNQEWSKRGLSGWVLPSHFSHALTTWSTCLWDPYPMMATSFNLIPWIITFDLIIKTNEDLSYHFSLIKITCKLMKLRNESLILNALI